MEADKEKHVEDAPISDRKPLDDAAEPDKHALAPLGTPSVSFVSTPGGTGAMHSVSASRVLKDDAVEKSPNGVYVKLPELVGKGSFKIVYKAQDTEHGKLVAWNEISLKGLGEKERKRIINEMTLLKTMQHPCLIKFYFAWVNKSDQKVIFITELMTSGTLREWCAKYPVSLRQIKRYCSDILRCVHYLHTPIKDSGDKSATSTSVTSPPLATPSGTVNGGGDVGTAPKPCVIHRDLKCDNIFIQEKSIKIGDLGLAATAGRTVLGTPEFMAPEMYEPGYGIGVDIYAFGMCILEMITGKSPFAEFKGIMDIFMRVEKDGLPENIRLLESGWPEAYAFVLRCLTPKAVLKPSDSAVLPPSAAMCAPLADDGLCDSHESDTGGPESEPASHNTTSASNTANNAQGTGATTTNTATTGEAATATTASAPRTTSTGPPSEVAHAPSATTITPSSLSSARYSHASKASTFSVAQLPSKIYVRPTAAELMTDPFLIITDEDAHRTTDDVKALAASKGVYVISGPDDEHRRKDIPPPSMSSFPAYELPPWVCADIMASNTLPSWISDCKPAAHQRDVKEATEVVYTALNASIPQSQSAVVTTASSFGTNATNANSTAAAATTTANATATTTTTGEASSSSTTASAATTTTTTITAPTSSSKRTQRSATTLDPTRSGQPPTHGKTLPSPAQKKMTAHTSSSASTLEQLSHDVRVLKEQMSHMTALLEFIATNSVAGGKEFVAAAHKRRASRSFPSTTSSSSNHSGSSGPRREGGPPDIKQLTTATPPTTAAPAGAVSVVPSESEEDGSKRIARQPSLPYISNKPPALDLLHEKDSSTPVQPVPRQKPRVQFEDQSTPDATAMESMLSATSTGTTIVHSNAPEGLWSSPPLSK